MFYTLSCKESELCASEVVELSVGVKFVVPAVQLYMFA